MGGVTSPVLPSAPSIVIETARPAPCIPKAGGAPSPVGQQSPGRLQSQEDAAVPRPYGTTPSILQWPILLPPRRLAHGAARLEAFGRHLAQIEPNPNP